jgi:hypothetical protein
MSSIIKDSSIWIDSSISTIKKNMFDRIMVGLITHSYYNEDIDEHIYVVEIEAEGSTIVGVARQISSFGDVYNFIEYGLRVNNYSDPKKYEQHLSGYSKVVGELAVVAAINGDYQNLIILGSLKNQARKLKRTDEDEMFFYSIYSGIETEINKDGEYSLTFKGLPTNEDKLAKSADGTAIDPPEYDEEIGGSSFKLEKDGSISFSDAHKEILQTFKIDKTANEFSFASKETTFKISGQEDLISFTAKDYKVEAKETFKVETSDLEIKGSKTAKLDSPKIAIGNGGVELLDQIVLLVDALATLIINSPTGPCTPFNTAPTWAQIEDIKGKISSIKGSL